MQTYNKQFSYKSFKFNIKLETFENDIANITINDLGYSNFYMKKSINIEKLEDSIYELENLAIKFVDSRTEESIIPLERKILNLGFVK